MLLGNLLDILKEKMPLEIRGDTSRLGEISVTGIECKSGEVREGDIFVAVKGLRHDSHKDIDEVISRGASAAVVSEDAVKDGDIEPDGKTIPIILVKNTRAALAQIYSAWYGEPQMNLKMIGVTGTNGKTSVSRLIYEILRGAGISCGIIGTLGCESAGREISIRSRDPEANMTTPEPRELFAILAEMVRDGCEYVVMEVSSHALLQSRVEPIIFDTAIFTNLSEDHLDIHGDMESYFSAKARLFDKSRRAIINYDDKYGRRLAERLEIPTYNCSAEGRDCPIFAEDVRLHGERGIEYKLVSGEMRLRIRSPLFGGFNVMNTMEAALSARLCGVKSSVIKECISSFGGIRGRCERLKIDKKIDFSVFIDYAHTPDALEGLLRSVRGFAREGQRLVLLFGCGGDRERQKRPIMGRIASVMADVTVITSDNSRSEEPADIISDILSGIDDTDGGICRVIEDRRDAIEYVIRTARRGDIILLAGKGHEEYEIDKGGKRPFSERELVREFVSRYYC